MRSGWRDWPAPHVWVALLVLPIGFGITVKLLHYMRWVDGPTVLMDVNAIPWRPAYYGIGSIIGYLLWGASAAICTFAGSALWAMKRFHPAGLLFATAGLCVVLLVDDVLMIHERLNRGAEAGLFAAYGVSCLAIFVYWRRLLHAHEPILLAAALGFLSAALVVDILLPFELRWSVIVEDTLKLAGQALWLGYFARLGCRELALACFRRKAMNPCQS